MAYPALAAECARQITARQAGSDAIMPAIAGHRMRMESHASSTTLTGNHPHRVDGARDPMDARTAPPTGAMSPSGRQE